MMELDKEQLFVNATSTHFISPQQTYTKQACSKTSTSRLANGLKQVTLVQNSSQQSFPETKTVISTSQHIKHQIHAWQWFKQTSSLPLQIQASCLSTKKVQEDISLKYFIDGLTSTVQMYRKMLNLPSPWNICLSP